MQLFIYRDLFLYENPTRKHLLTKIPSLYPGSETLTRNIHFQKNILEKGVDKVKDVAASVKDTVKEGYDQCVLWFSSISARKY